MSTSELELDSLPVTANMVMDAIFQLVSEFPGAFDRLESILIDVQDVFVKWYLRS